MTRRGATAALMALALAGPLTAQSSPEGSWIVAGWTVDGQAVTPSQRGLFIFTKTNYSIMFVGGTEPRVNLGADPTAEEKAAAFDSFTANSGRHTVEGDRITLKAFMAKQPDYMAAWANECVTGACPNDVVVTFKVEGETMTLTWAESGRRPVRVVSLRKVG